MTDPLFRTDDDTKWGDGKGSDLTAAEADVNFWSLLVRIRSLEAGEGTRTIDYVDITDGVVRIYYTDYSSDGPFYLPTPVLNPRGEWANDRAYLYGDVVTVTARRAAYIVLRPHTSPSSPEEFDPDAVDDNDDSLYMLFFNFPASNTQYDVPISVVGLVAHDVDALIWQEIVTRSIDMTDDGNGNGMIFGYLAVPSDTTDLVLSLENQGTQVATITFAVGENTPTVEYVASPDLTWTAGQRRAIRVVSATDPYMSDLSISLRANRIDL